MKTLTRVVDSVTERDAKRMALKVFAPSAGVGAAYEFQYSLGGGRTWLATRPQIRTTADVTIDGLPPRSMVHLRYRAIVKSVTGSAPARMRTGRCGSRAKKTLDRKRSRRHLIR